MKDTKKRTETPLESTKGSKTTGDKGKTSKAPPKAEERVLPANAVDTEKMDRRSLKGSIEELRKAGVTIEYDSADDNTVLRKKLADGLDKVAATPKALEILSTIDQGSVKGCIGVFINLKAVGCLTCPDKKTCLEQFMENLDNDFSTLKKADDRAAVEEQVKETLTSEEEIPVKPTKTKKAKGFKGTTIKYDAKRLIYIPENAKNPTQKSDPQYVFFKAYLDERTMPETVGELRALITDHFEVSDEEEKAQATTLEFVKRMAGLKILYLG